MKRISKKVNLFILGGIAITTFSSQSYAQVGAIGNNITGAQGSALGKNNSVSGSQATALGFNTVASGTQTFASGHYCTASGPFSSAMGARVLATSAHAMAFGIDVRATANRSMTIGTGMGNGASNALINNTPKSLMIGFNSNIPTLFVGPSSGANTSGNVGIGTSTPKGKLHVHSGPSFSQAPRFTMASSGTNLAGVNTSLSLINLDQTTNNWARMHFVTPLSNGSEVDLVSLAVQYKNRTAGQETGDFVIATAGNGVYSEKFRIAGNGNVGIGTNNISDAFKLSVAGKMRAEEIEVSLSSGWADYVFAEDYKLKSLEEVEQYINEHNHLPNIPSAQEIEEEGLNIGEMQVKMMEKIEELTLYMIALKKENEELKKMIEQDSTND